MPHSAGLFVFDLLIDTGKILPMNLPNVSFHWQRLSRGKNVKYKNDYKPWTIWNILMIYHIYTDWYQQELANGLAKCSILSTWGQKNRSLIKVYHFSQLPNVQCCWPVTAWHSNFILNDMPYKAGCAPPNKKIGGMHCYDKKCNKSDKCNKMLHFSLLLHFLSQCLWREI